MSYIINIRIPLDSYKKYGIDRDKFLESVKNNAREMIPNAEVEIVKSKEVK